ncbi:KDEL motif-containing protein 1, partial [Armadillidium nasatum]
TMILSILSNVLILLSLSHNFNLVHGSNEDQIKVDVNNTKVFGPGLFPELIVLPVRYFFIETYNSKNVRIKSSSGDRIKVQVEGETSNGLHCRVWVQVLDRYDGSYIVRYRTYQTCFKTTIHVMYNYRHIAESPYKFEGPIYAEDCNCPVKDVSSWTEMVGCPQSYPQIKNDLSNFEEVDMNIVLKIAIERYHQPKARSFCNYVVLKNQVFRKCYGEHVGFSMFMDNILHSLARKMILPDFEFIVNLGDWPLSENKVKPIIPIFSWCGSDETADILMPTYDLTESTLEMMGRVTIDVFSIQSNNKVPWKDKKPIAFWRGRDSRRERLDLITLGKKHPDIFNVSLTNFFFFRDEEEKYGPKAKYESFFKFFDYKYQISIDGTVAAYRFPYLLAGSGVILKQDSGYYEHFYKELEPYVHYIPFKSDLSDLIEKIQWAKDHDSEALKISRNGRTFVQENLLPKDIYCYHALLFQEWSRKLVSEVNAREGMELSPNKENEQRFGDCKCHRKKKHDEL